MTVYMGEKNSFKTVIVTLQTITLLSVDETNRRLHHDDCDNEEGKRGTNIHTMK